MNTHKLVGWLEEKHEKARVVGDRITKIQVQGNEVLWPRFSPFVVLDENDVVVDSPQKQGRKLEHVYSKEAENGSGEGESGSVDCQAEGK